jgi:hypothetical protein
VLLFMLAMEGAAVAIPVPPDDLRSPANLHNEAIPLSATRQDSDVNIGPAGALLERDYFEAPRSTNSGALLCRVEPDVFAKVRLTQSCR